ncbi:class I SAM-dependent methyltransferase [Streptomyces griseus]|uniref:class I SAM-dependent methyltransferase n=1 Tax=Streptomyces griseus TaxID=1911 RepID=UPI00225BBD99|nr:class I SAM-dependent methyltransferase [Streptomyces griseus]MCX4713004.1 methyltransferase domain-containing protein [Streptomyces griseus]
MADTLVEYAPPGPLAIAELGCGIGGALRHILTALAGRTEVTGAVGIDVVEEHARLTDEICAASPLGVPVTTVCAAAEDTGLPDGSFDAVFASGSVSHFSDVAAVLHEAHRLLRPGGLLTFTEEVSLVPDPAALSDAFRAAHPGTVFHRATADERRAQLHAAGFVDVSVRHLGDWAVSILRMRWMSMRVNREKLVEVYGARQQAAVLDTIAATLAEVRRGTVVPAQVTARRRPVDRG